MDRNFKAMLDLYSMAITGEKRILNYYFDCEKVIEYASGQGILPIVLVTLKEYMPSNDETEALYSEYYDFLVKDKLRMHNIKKIYKKLTDNGIEFCILKGETLSTLYSCSDARISGDIDIYVNEKDEEKTLEIFKDSGFDIKYRTDDGNHDICYNKSIGEVEVHVKLYYDFMEDVWFDNVNMLDEKFISRNGVSTLGVTDGYLYVILHAIKHFLSGGLSLRHISDILLYLKHYEKEINFSRINDIISHLKFNMFMQCAYAVGDKYLNIKTFDYEVEEEIIVSVFDDIVKGGIFGKNQRERLRFFEVYNELRFSSFKKENFRKYMTSMRRKNAVRYFFVSPAKVKQRYNENLIMCYYRHYKSCIQKIMKRKKIVNDVICYKTPEKTDMVVERIDLLKKMKMI